MDDANDSDGVGEWSAWAVVEGVCSAGRRRGEMCRGCCWCETLGCDGAAAVVGAAASWTCLVIASIARSSPTKRSFIPSSSSCIRWLVAFSAARRSFSLLRTAFSRARMSSRVVASSRRERRESSSSRLRWRELAAERRLRSLRASLRASREVDSSEPVKDVEASETVSSSSSATLSDGCLPLCRLNGGVVVDDEVEADEGALRLGIAVDDRRAVSTVWACI